MNNKCKLKRVDNHLVLTMPNGEIIPNQIDMFIEDNNGCHSVATISLHVDISEIEQDESYLINKKEIDNLKEKINELNELLNKKHSFTNSILSYADNIFKVRKRNLWK